MGKASWAANMEQREAQHSVAMPCLAVDGPDDATGDAARLRFANSYKVTATVRLQLSYV